MSISNPLLSLIALVLVLWPTSVLAATRVITWKFSVRDSRAVRTRNVHTDILYLAVAINGTGIALPGAGNGVPPVVYLGDRGGRHPMTFEVLKIVALSAC